MYHIHPALPVTVLLNKRRRTRIIIPRIQIIQSRQLIIHTRRITQLIIKIFISLSSSCSVIIILITYHTIARLISHIRHTRPDILIIKVCMLSIIFIADCRNHILLRSYDILARLISFVR